MNTLVLGMGNPILTDDGVGIEIAHRLKERKPELDVEETSEAGIALLDFIVGYDRLIIVDSIKTEKGKPGELYKLDIGALKPTAHLTSLHGVDIATAFELGQKFGYHMPRQVSIYAVEVKDNTSFGEECTEEVGSRVSLITEQIIGEEKL
ncbi:MAG: hydrogenase maturation protease [Dehalococcoidia bacterium]|jgi:hydrogenase maturation protease